MSTITTSTPVSLTCDQFKIDDFRNGLRRQDGTPQVQEIPRLFSEQECNTLIQYANRTGFERPNFGNARICERLHTVNEDLSTWVLNKLKTFLPEVVEIDGAKWRLSRFTHHWRYVHYTPGGHFAPHYDGSKMLPWKEMSVYTVQVYLNDAFKDGSTRFYTDYVPNRMHPHVVEYGKVCQFNPNAPTHEVKPETGKVLVFDHTQNTLHDGEPVSSGEKYIMRGDVLYEAVEEDHEKLDLPDSADRLWSNEAARRGDTKSYVGEIWHCQCGDDLCGVKEIGAPKQEGERASKLSGMRVILLSGKRAAGKDFVADKITRALEKLEWRVHCTSLGILNKQKYAEKHGLDAVRLENDRQHKEEHRIELVRHHGEMDKINPEWAVKAVVEAAADDKADVLIVTDIRRLKDLEWFQKNSATAPVILRIDASEEARKMRGCDPHPVKDQNPTEVELDDYNAWDARFDNSSNTDEALDGWIQSSVVLPMVLSNSRSTRTRVA